MPEIRTFVTYTEENRTMFGEMASAALARHLAGPTSDNCHRLRGIQVKDGLLVGVFFGRKDKSAVVIDVQDASFLQINGQPYHLGTLLADQRGATQDMTALFHFAAEKTRVAEPA